MNNIIKRLEYLEQTLISQQKIIKIHESKIKDHELTISKLNKDLFIKDKQINIEQDYSNKSHDIQVIPSIFAQDQISTPGTTNESKETSIQPPALISLVDASQSSDCEITHVDSNNIIETNPSKSESKPTVFHRNEPKEVYKYNQVVRNKQDRKRMHAVECLCCKDYYEITNQVPALFELGASRSKTSDSRVQMHSRHRVNHPIAQSPPGFWNTTMPTSDDIQQEKEERKKRRSKE